jgi:hypothetical protein
MQMTSALPPAYAYVKSHGDLLKQLGAVKVEATDSMTIKATYVDNSKAVNAEALLKDTAWGAKLVIDNQSLTTDMPVASGSGIADVLRGVEGLEVYEIAGGPKNENTEIIGVTFDAGLAGLLADLTEATPIKGVTVEIPQP